MKRDHLGKSIRIALFVLGIVIMGLGVGCASGGSYKSATPSDTSSDRVTQESKSTNMSGSTEYTVNEEESPQISTEVGYNRKVIKTGEMQLQTEHFNDTVEQIMAYTQSLGGYVENSNIQGKNFYENSGNTRSAHLAVRLPQKQFDTFINKSGEFGNVLYISSNSEDITAQYVDTEMRIKVLKTRHDRLLELLKQSGDLKELFEIEQEVGEVTYEIESLSGQLQNYDQLVDMSTISIEIQEVNKIEITVPIVTFGDQIASTFRSSIEGVVNVLQGLLLMFIAIIPFLIIIVPIGVVVIILIKRYNKQKKD